MFSMAAMPAYDNRNFLLYGGSLIEVGVGV
jgi:hypothetical protein